MGISLMSKRRRFIPFFAMLVVCLLASTVIAPVGVAQTVVNPPQRFAPDRVLVVFHPGASASEVSAAHSQARGNVVNTIDAYGVQVVAIPTGTVLDAVQHYRRNPNVKFAEPNYRRTLSLHITPIEGSEPALNVANNFTEQWWLHNEGQGFGATVDPWFGTLIAPVYEGVADADIDALEGWDISYGSADIWIAVIDSGISCDHADLAAKCLLPLETFVDEHYSRIGGESQFNLAYDYLNDLLPPFR